MSHKIFDSLIHINSTTDVKATVTDMSDSEIYRAMVCPEIFTDKPITNQSLYNSCSGIDALVPVALLDNKTAFEAQIKEYSQFGFKYLKLHQRYLGQPLNIKQFKSIFDVCKNNQMTVLLCTYTYCQLGFEYLDTLSLLQTCQPKCKVILIHGGVHDVLKYSEYVRHNDNLLLDLSFTLLKYQGSSLDLDISFLFNKFDRRICIGSDFPDFNFKQFRSRFEFFFKGLSDDKIENIAWKNLENF